MKATSQAHFHRYFFGGKTVIAPSGRGKGGIFHCWVENISVEMEKFGLLDLDAW